MVVTYKNNSETENKNVWEGFSGLFGGTTTVEPKVSTTETSKVNTGVIVGVGLVLIAFSFIVLKMF